MTRRTTVLSGGALLVALLALGSTLFMTGQGPASRTAFVIATGPTRGTYFPVGEAIASIVSHPPGLYRCETADLCGPPGLVASVRTSPGTASNVLAVNAHMVDAAFAQSDVIEDAVAGRGAFKAQGPQAHVRVLANLFPEELHLLALPSAQIHSVGDLKGKRVSLGPAESGTIVTARAVLAAFHLSPARLRLNGDSSDIAADDLSKQQLDALFFVGGAPVPLVRDLVEGGSAFLIPISGEGRTRLLKKSHSLTAMKIPAGLYPNTGTTETVGVHAMLIVSDEVPDAEAYAILASLFNPANRDALTGSHRSAQAIRLGTAATDLPAPLHPGAERFYREKGVLRPAGSRSGQS